MPDTTLPTDLRISAQIRIAAAQGISMMVVHKGDPTSGSICLKINRLDGTAEILSQIRMEDELVWVRAGTGDIIPEREADAYLDEQTSFDPDLWVIEVEDKQGRHWFPEKIVTLKA